MINLKASIEALRRQLRVVHFTRQIDFQGLLTGSPVAFIALFRDFLTEHDPMVTECLLEKGFCLTGTSDQRFMEMVYRYLRDVANNNPRLTLTQFFVTGYARRKIDLATTLVDCVHTQSVRRKGILRVNPRQPLAAAPIARLPPAACGWKIFKPSVSGAPLFPVESSRCPCEAFPDIPARNRVNTPGGDRHHLVDVDASEPHSSSDYNQSTIICAQNGPSTDFARLSPLHQSSQPLTDHRASVLEQYSPAKLSTFNVESKVNQIEGQLTRLLNKLDTVMDRLDKLEVKQLQQQHQQSLPDLKQARLVTDLPQKDMKLRLPIAPHRGLLVSSDFDRPQTLIVSNNLPPQSLTTRATCHTTASMVGLRASHRNENLAKPMDDTASAGNSSIAIGSEAPPVNFRVQVDRISSMLAETRELLGHSDSSPTRNVEVSVAERAIQAPQLVLQ